MTRKILIVENDEKLIDILNEVLVGEGYTLHCIPQTRDIRPIAREFMPDLILLDFLLPGTNGGELCSQLKRQEDTRHIPVIIFSAFPKVMLSLGDYGCNAFISKPFDLSELLYKIRECIDEPSRSYL